MRTALTLAFWLHSTNTLAAFCAQCTSRRTHCTIYVHSHTRVLCKWGARCSAQLSRRRRRSAGGTDVKCPRCWACCARARTATAPLVVSSSDAADVLAAASTSAPKPHSAPSFAAGDFCYSLTSRTFQRCLFGQLKRLIITRRWVEKLWFNWYKQGIQHHDNRLIRIFSHWCLNFNFS